MISIDYRFSAGILVLLSVLFVIHPAAAQQESTALDKTKDVTEYYSKYRLATSLYSYGQYNEAASLFAVLTHLNPGDASLWFKLGRSREILDQPAEAIEAYRVALDLGYRSTPWVAYRIARLFSQLGKKDSSIAWLELALEKGYDDRPGITGDPAFESLQNDPRFARITGQTPNKELTRDEQWQYDLDFLVGEAKRMHAGPDRPAYSKAFNSAASALHEKIPGLSNDRIVIEMGRLMVLLGDGHTGIYGPAPDSPFQFEGSSLPMLFYMFEDGIHIVNAVGDARQWIGSRVLKFGMRTTDDIVKELPHYVHHDNPFTPTWLGIHFYLRDLSLLHAFEATDDVSRITLTLRDRQGGEHRVTFDGGDYNFPRKLRAPSNSSDSPPLYLRDVDCFYWLHHISEENTVYWQFNQVRDMGDGPSIAAFADSLRTMLERTNATNLIVDVRHNNGGNNGLLDPLLRTLVWWGQDMPEHQIFVITGRNTFSAAQNFINRVERWTNAVFVGEPSSSRPNFYGEETNVVLPFSRVRGSISTMYWQDSDPGDMRRWIAPHVPVVLSSTHYFSNHDPAMAAVLNIIAKSK